MSNLVHQSVFFYRGNNNSMLIKANFTCKNDTICEDFLFLFYKLFQCQRWKPDLTCVQQAVSFFSLSFRLIALPKLILVSRENIFNLYQIHAFILQQLTVQIRTVTKIQAEVQYNVRKSTELLFYMRLTTTLHLHSHLTA